MISRSRAIHSVVFPNNRTPLGRFLQECLQQGQPFTAWIYHVLFAIHRWEFMEWITTVLSQNETVLCERYTWSGVAYSSTLDPTLDLQGFMSLEKGLIAPDLVVYIDTPPTRVVGKHAVSTLFDDGGFQQQLYDLYSHPDIWNGVQVLNHVTQENKWNSSKALVLGFRTGVYELIPPLRRGNISGRTVALVPSAPFHIHFRMQFKSAMVAFQLFIIIA